MAILTCQPSWTVEAPTHQVLGLSAVLPVARNLFKGQLMAVNTKLLLYLKLYTTLAWMMPMALIAPQVLIWHNWNEKKNI